MNLTSNSAGAIKERSFKNICRKNTKEQKDGEELRVRGFFNY